MDSSDCVSDDEVLYRRLLYENNHYKILDSEQHTVQISSQAFADRSYKISVDRAKLCNFDPVYTQKQEECAVVSLVTRDVRKIDTVIERDKKGRDIIKHSIDVIPDKMEENQAHALIVPNPEYRNPNPRSLFRKLLEALARLANDREWEIPPWEFRFKA
jgi:hypothetical protein